MRHRRLNSEKNAEACIVRAWGALRVKFSGQPREASRAAPLLVEHTREIPREEGYSAAAIEAIEAIEAFEAFEAMVVDVAPLQLAPVGGNSCSA